MKRVVQSLISSESKQSLKGKMSASLDLEETRRTYLSQSNTACKSTPILQKPCKNIESNESMQMPKGREADGDTARKVLERWSVSTYPTIRNLEAEANGLETMDLTNRKLEAVSGLELSSDKSLQRCQQKELTNQHH